MTHTDNHQNAAMYIQAFQFIPGYAYILDKNGILLDCNARLLQLLQLSHIPSTNPGSLYKMLSEHGLWTDEQTKILKKNDIDVIVSGEARIDTQELPIINAKGDATYYLTSRIPLLDNNHHVNGLLVLLADITHERYLSDQVEKMTQQLQKQNANTTHSTNHTISPQKTTPPMILIVEDNAIAQKAAQAILMNNDCIVDMAQNDIEFLATFKPGKYDLVFMDIGLENTSGYMMAKQIRSQEKNTSYHVPIIALTGYEADTVQFDCDYYQMEGVITKPLTTEQVKQIIQHYVFHINLEITGFKSARLHY